MNTDATGKPANMTGFSIFVVLLIPLVWTFEAAVIGPALGALAVQFPDATPLQIKMVMTTPLLTAIIFSPVSGLLARYIDRRVILIFGLVLYGITGMIPAWLTDINQILILRLITGVGVGLVSPIPNAIITEHFTGDRQRRLLGLTTSISQLANVVASIVAGMLLIYGWQYPFYTFGFVLLIAVLALIGTPKSATVNPGAEQTYHDEQAHTFPPIVYGLFAFNTLNFALGATLPTTVAIYMMANQIGEPWMIGIVISFPGLATFLVSPFYPEIRKLTGSFVVPLGFLIYAIGFYIVSGAEGVVGISAGALTLGIGSAFLTPHIFSLTADYISHSHRDTAYGVVTAGIGAGILMSPFYQSLLAVFGSQEPAYIYFASSIVCSGLVILSVAAVLAPNSNARSGALRQKVVGS